MFFLLNHKSSIGCMNSDDEAQRIVHKEPGG